MTQVRAVCDNNLEAAHGVASLPDGGVSVGAIKMLLSLTDLESCIFSNWLQ